ncbi:ATP-binding cassette domain-containing protein [Nocardia jinanensis]|uniref:Daunorubicin resistance protein DrrA family ABC transporter ATP-binding protein n=1 Tax=Nocardia jinanensis TaxID=382504 RepID=A0A917VY01_9NOCA|nr:ATP-binding cassette domain-containing protein [Nocardia jinanensis]GGL35738.1 daunorubicin resistance protein DrrA family ABC transporter ATP-binding protein [Nocardia jinanensis]
MTAIEVEGLTKRYGERTVVDTVDLRVDPGRVHALLGPNGSGKTTTVRMLATLLRPDSGHARIAGYDTVRETGEVARRIGLVGQFHAVDPRLTGLENLTLFGRMNGLPGRQARIHAGELLDRFDLAHAADRLARDYSGGMRRRLDIVAAMVVRPAVLFLDEPTTALDPRSRNQIYSYVADFVAEGTTVLLTTQYLDEAERLADTVTILDAGRVVATGTPRTLTAEIGGGVELVADPRRHDEITRVLEDFGGRPVGDTPASADPAAPLSYTFHTADVPLLPILRALDEIGIDIHDIGRRRATLDDAFLALTGPEPRTTP